MMGHIYVGPYAVLQPSLALVVEDGDGVAGYAVGTADTLAWEEQLERDWWPSLRQRYADPADLAPADRTPDQRRAFTIHHPAPTPAPVAERYPAHLHMNLLPRTQRRGVGSTLLALWLDKVHAAGAHHVHVAVNRANLGGARFWAAHRFAEIDLPGSQEQRARWLGRSIR